jgi:polyisoprenyl-phosphate glycosyltransferase
LNGCFGDDVFLRRFDQTGVYYDRDTRYAGKTKWTYRKLFEFAIEGLTSFSYLPLKLASFLGIFVSFLSFLYAIFIFIRTIIFSNPVPGYPSLIVIILFLSGIQLFTIGIIGEYIGRTYSESKRRKTYFVKDRMGFKKNKRE